MNLRRSLAAALLFVALVSCDNTLKNHFSRVQRSSVSLASPTNLFGTPAPYATFIYLTWTDNATSETGYRVEANDAPFDFGPPLIVQLLPADSNFFSLPVQPNRTYFIRVFATAGSSDSPPSDVIVVTTPDVPPAPTDLLATTVSSARIRLTWTNPGGAVTGNRIERSVDGGTTWTTLAVFSVPTTSASDTGLVADGRYGYRVYASNSTNESGPSTESWSITLTNAVLYLPTAGSNNVGRYSSIAVSSSGNEFVSHYDATNGNLLYTETFERPISYWAVDTGPSGPEAGGGDGTAIALDGAGKVHLVAHDLTNRRLRYVTNASGTFIATTIDSTGSNGTAPKIVIAPDGSIHILYRSDHTLQANLKHATLPSGGSSWLIEEILPFTTTLISWSLSVDSSGKLHVSYSHTDDGLTYELVHGLFSGGSRTFTPVTSAGTPLENSIALDSSGFPHIAFYEQSGKRLLHATSAR